METQPQHLTAKVADLSRFQSIEEFDRYCEVREEAEGRIAQAQQKVKGPPAKKQKRVIDLDALAAEKVALEEIGQEINWIGKLHEYRSVNPVKDGGGLIYIERPSAQDSVRHTCTLLIAETPKPFGADGISFANKKTAKQYASRKAIDWLVENNFMPADGTVKFPKIKHFPQLPPKPGTIQPSPQLCGALDTKTWASQVPELCTRLGFGLPEYVITKVSDNAALYYGYAHFRNEPRIADSKIGEANNVYGQKKAKEAIAEELVRFLKDIERQRLELLEVDKKKRKRTPILS